MLLDLLLGLLEALRFSSKGQAKEVELKDSRFKILHTISTI